MHDYRNDPPLTRLHRDGERLAIEQAVREAQLEHREQLRRAILRRLPRPRR